jgi:catalase
VFFVRDASKFQDFIHSQKRLPQTGLRDNDMQWDFWTLSPESAHQVTILMSDRGTPRTLRNMNGYGSHTFSTMNDAGERFWVKFHFITQQGVENFTDSEAKAMTAEDPDFHRRDLFGAIAGGNAPEWRLEMQVMPFADAGGYRFNPFDLTKVWPHADYPLVTVGRMVLNRNPENFFAEVEQAAFSPANLVPGIGLSPDRMLMGRIFSYHDTHLHRVGTNYEQLPINSPKVEVHSYNKEGAMTFHHAGDQPVYAPNSYGGPAADADRAGQVNWEVKPGELGRYAYDKHVDDDDFGQAGSLVRDVLSETDREHLVTNVVGHASDHVSEEVQRRVVAYWSLVDKDLGARVASGLGVDTAKLNGASEIVAAHANQA